jgi:predicted transcriptional regulator
MSHSMTSRNRTEITIQILEFVNGCDHDDGTTQTRLMSKLFLDNAQLKDYLVFLIGNDLLSYDPKMRRFKITEKGLMFLQAYNQIDKMLKKQQI